MHRFLKSIMIHNTRVALRSDASIWLIAQRDGDVSVDRGSGWATANKLRLCRDDRVRIGESGISLSELCSRLGVDFQQACDSTEKKNDFSDSKALMPLSVPASVIDNARRNPDTGQIEPSTKEQQ